MLRLDSYMHSERGRIEHRDSIPSVIFRYTLDTSEIIAPDKTEACMNTSPQNYLAQQVIEAISSARPAGRLRRGSASPDTCAALFLS